ncbi:hypothetical protein Tco_0352109 [Tanacetum coccineum]
MPARMKDPGLCTLLCKLGDSEPFDTLTDLGSCMNIIPLYLFKNLKIKLLEDTDHVFGLADITNTYHHRELLRTKAKITVGEGITRSVFGVKEIDLGEEEAPYWTTLRALPINLKGNIWQSKDLIENPISWDKPPKNRDGALYVKIRIIDSDGEEFTKTF